jgi:hypothetical protein
MRFALALAAALLGFLAMLTAMLTRTTITDTAAPVIIKVRRNSPQPLSERTDACRAIESPEACNAMPGCRYMRGTVYVPWRRLEKMTEAEWEVVKRHERELSGCFPKRPRR